MPKIAYEYHRFSASSRLMIQRSNDIIAEYQRQGFTLTLRQLYYQHVARDLLPNRQSEYKKLGDVINHARLAGEIDWNAIEDRTRWLRSSDYDHGNPDTWLGRVAGGFSKSRWEDQPYYVEVWVEKDALGGVIESACEPLKVPWFACRGYTSQSEVWGASQRLLDEIRAGKEIVIIHLGDHDPSGLDMTRDIESRLFMFIGAHLADERDQDSIRRSEVPLEVRRLALNMDQVEEHQPPPNPAKLTDSRAQSYISEWGDESWELDALDVATLSSLISEAIEPLIDQDRWSEAEQREQEGQDRLRLVASNWQKAVDHIQETSK